MGGGAIAPPPICYHFTSVVVECFILLLQGEGIGEGNYSWFSFPSFLSYGRGLFRSVVKNFLFCWYGIPFGVLSGSIPEEGFLQLADGRTKQEKAEMDLIEFSKDKNKNIQELGKELNSQDCTLESNGWMKITSGRFAGWSYKAGYDPKVYVEGYDKWIFLEKDGILLNLHGENKRKQNE
jgi:hypothetical protein